MENLITTKLLNEIPEFENFLSKIGFKRIDGSVYGLLVLSPRALTSDEIVQGLKISQSAVSNSLKTLSHYGAVQTVYSSEKRANVHKAKTDSLEIVSSIFKKREQETIQELKAMALRVRLELNEDDKSHRVIVKRIDSIISTCNIAESVMSFVISMGTMGVSQKVEKVVQKLPKVLSTLTHSTETVEGFSKSIKSLMAHGLKNLAQREQENQRGELK